MVYLRQFREHDRKSSLNIWAEFKGQFNVESFFFFSLVVPIFSLKSFFLSFSLMELNGRWSSTSKRKFDRRTIWINMETTRKKKRRARPQNGYVYRAIVWATAKWNKKVRRREKKKKSSSWGGSGALTFLTFYILLCSHLSLSLSLDRKYIYVFHTVFAVTILSVNTPPPPPPSRMARARLLSIIGRVINRRRLITFKVNTSAAYREGRWSVCENSVQIRRRQQQKKRRDWNVDRNTPGEPTGLVR